MRGNKIAATSVMILGLLVALSVPAQAFGQELSPPAQDLQNVFPKKPPYSPYAGRHFLVERVYWGDTHLHTSFSMQMLALSAADWDLERLTVSPKVRRSPLPAANRLGWRVPLDFLVVADHSDGFGFFPLMMSGDPAILADPQGRRWYDMVRGGQGAAAAIEIVAKTSARERSEGSSSAGNNQLSERVARDYQRSLFNDLKQAMTPAVSLPLLALNGPPIQEETTSIATFFFATTAPRPAWLSHTRLRSLWAATIHATYGNG